MKLNINWSKLILPFVVVGVGILYFFIQGIKADKSKPDVLNSAKIDFAKHKSDFEKLAGFCYNIYTYSSDWQIENHPRQGVIYKSYTPFEKCKLSFAEYVKRYYKNIDTTTSPCFVPDFEIPVQRVYCFYNLLSFTISN